MSAALPTELVAVLRAVATAAHCEGSTIAQNLGRGASAELQQLVERRLVRQLARLRRDGNPSTLYTITAAGRRALASRAPAPRHTVVARPPMPGGEETYRAPELVNFAARPGALDALAFPSRMGQRLHYRDGRITDLEGRPC